MANCTVEIRGINDAEAKALSKKIATLMRWSGFKGKRIEVWEVDPKDRCLSHMVSSTQTN